MTSVCCLTADKSNILGIVFIINIVSELFKLEQKNFIFKHEHSKLSTNTLPIQCRYSTIFSPI